MNKEELAAVILFFEKVRSRIGPEDFERHRDIILQSAADIIDVHKSQGGDVAELLENENMIIVIVLICSAQDLMDTLLERKEED